ncbi:MAG TPA: hypothetical protein VIS05_12995 [Ilumatobacter sp.]
MTSSLAALTPARDRCLPVDETFAHLLPDGGLRRGWVVGCTGPAALSVALALVARPATVGSWMAAVGVPMLGVEAAGEFGVPLARLVRVDTTGRADEWAERVAAAADGFDIVITHPPADAERAARRVRTRLQARGAVLIAIGPTSTGLSCDVAFGTSAPVWHGLGQGSGHLIARRVTVTAGGRRLPRPAERELWLPGPDGRVSFADRGPVGAARSDDHGGTVATRVG